MSRSTSVLASYSVMAIDRSQLFYIYGFCTYLRYLRWADLIPTNLQNGIFLPKLLAGFD